MTLSVPLTVLELAGNVDNMPPSSAADTVHLQTPAERPTPSAAASTLATEATAPDSATHMGGVPSSHRSRGGRGRGRGSGIRRQGPGRKQGAGRKSGTSFLDEALAGPAEGPGNRPVPGGAAEARDGDDGETQGISERTEQDQENVEEETEEQAHERHLADARWNAAIKKDATLKPRSKKDYIRGLRTYKV